jgi:hypothetical protein
VGVLSRAAALASQTPLERPLRKAIRARAALEDQGPLTAARHAAAYLRDRAARHAYHQVSEQELRAARSSDTAFIFGSGRSLLEITPTEWERIAAANTIGFTEFVRQRFVRVDYHVVGEILDAAEFARLLRQNPLYGRTILVLQEGLLAEAGNALVGRRLLPPRTRVFRYRRTSRGAFAPPSTTFRGGLVHGWNTAISVTNFALLLGFRQIVLAGVDLYNREYFWLQPGERRPNIEEGSAVADPFPTADPVIDLFARWRKLLEPEGVELFVYNPRSLLARALPVFRFDA